MNCHKDKADRDHHGAGEIHDAPGALEGVLVVPRAHLLAHQDGGGIGEAGEEADYQAFQSAEYRNRRDRLIGLVCIYAAAALIRMGNWTQNDTFRAAGDASFGTILEIVFMWAMLIPAVWLTGMVWKLPTLLVFTCCYIDEPIRYIMMQVHLFRGKWIKPVTPEGQQALQGWKPPTRKMA